VIGNQISVKPAESAAVYVKPKGGKLNPPEGADFNSILLSVMPFGNVYNAESAENSAAVNGNTEAAFMNAATDDAALADNAAAAPATDNDAATDTASAEEAAAYNTQAKNTSAGYTVIYDAPPADNLTKKPAADGIPENAITKENGEADIENPVGDEGNLSLESIARDTPYAIPADTGNAATEKPSGKDGVKKPDLPDTSENSDEPQSADEPAYTIQYVLTVARFGFTGFNVNTDVAAKSAALQTNRAPVRSNGIAAVKSLSDQTPETPAGEVEKDALSAELTLPDPFAEMNTRRYESKDYKIFTDITDRDYIGAEPPAPKKATGNAAIETPGAENGKKNEPPNFPNMLRLETRGIEYADIRAQETEAVGQSVQVDTGIAEQISAGIKAEAEKGETSMFRMKLKPEGLGEVTVKLTRKTDKIDVQISTELTSTKELISKELDALRVRLNSDVGEKQYQFASVAVEHETSGTNASFANGHNSRGGYNASYGNERHEYQNKAAPDDKPMKYVYERLGNRLIDYIA
jgi:hypothetical protein